MAGADLNIAGITMNVNMLNSQLKGRHSNCINKTRFNNMLTKDILQQKDTEMSKIKR